VPAGLGFVALSFALLEELGSNHTTTASSMIINMPASAGRDRWRVNELVIGNDRMGFD